MMLPTLFAAGGLTDVSPGLIVWSLVTFSLLAILLRWKAWGPILATVEKREKNIREALESAAKQQEEAKQMIEEHKAALETARKESADMVRKAQAEVEAARDEQMQKAREEAEKLLESARKQMAEEQKQAFAEVKAAAVDLALAAAQKLIESQMDEAQQKKLVEEYLASLPEARN